MITHKQKKRKLALSSHEIDQIIQEAEENPPDELTALVCNCDEDMRFLERQIQQKGMIGIEEY